MTFVWATFLIIWNTAAIPAVAVGLPGTWLMIGAMAVITWWQPNGVDFFDPGTLIALVVLAGIGELLEFLSGVIGSKQSGGSKWGAGGAMVGGLIGGIAATFMIPIPIVGSIIGACLGAFAGALIAETAGGQSLKPSLQIGTGAAVGRLLGTIAKLVIAVVMWIVATVAIFV